MTNQPSPSIKGFLERHFATVFLLVLVVLVVVAWSNRFIQDDAFISFRYAENLSQGKGLVWNEGERVEGYTNFLWVLLISLAIHLGGEPILSSYALGLALFAGSLVVTYRVSWLILRSRPQSLLVMMLVGLNHSFSSYATGGLETQLQAFLFVAIVHSLGHLIVGEGWSMSRTIGLSVLLSLATLTRLDSLLIVAPVVIAFSWALARDGEMPARNKVLHVSIVGAILASTVGVWLLWKLSYYGETLPNTYYAKAASGIFLRRGYRYLRLFVQCYDLGIFLLLFLLAVRRLRPKLNFAVLLLLAICTVWSAYLLAIGGDFMEFRLLVPILPFIYLILTWFVFSFIRQRIVRVGLVVFLLITSLNRFHGVDGISTIKGLEYHIQRNHWKLIGEILGEAFRYDRRVIIATSAAGAIPYYSGLTTIDMFGMNDRWIARHGRYFRTGMAGHQRLATPEYLRERDVNLLVGHPHFRPDAEQFRKFGCPDESSSCDLELIEIPITEDKNLYVLYLSRSALVDETIRREGWRTLRAGEG